MSNLSFTARFDPASLEVLHGFANYARVLEPEMLIAMDRALSLVQAVATDTMYASFINPSGQAESAWETVIHNPYLGELDNTAPYSLRLEYGFSGKTDALGRFYQYWPDYHWAQRTLDSTQNQIADQFQAAVDYANLSLGRGGIP